MGKQSRRKSGGNKKAAPKQGNTATATAAVQATPSKSNLVNRLRQGDLRIRHGALTAASATIFSPESLANKAPINMELIQTMSERIMDDDAPCAMCAVGCLGNYILFQESSNQVHGNKVETLLTPILLTKIDQACQAVERIGKQMIEYEEKQRVAAESAVAPTEGAHTNYKGKDKKSIQKSMDKYALSIMEQWSIQSLCLHALCGIVEGTATNNESSSILYHQRDQFLGTTMKSFLLATEMITALATPDSDMKKFIATKENQSNIISDVLVYAARTLHSSCDDNSTLVASLMAMESGWNSIISSIGNGSLPTLARLHCCGITVICRQFVKSNEMEQIVVQQSLPLLSQCTMYSNDIASALHKHVVECYQNLRKEKDDENIEKDIVRMIDKKKESARVIARRQKQVKADMKEKAKQEADAEMNEEEEKEEEQEQSGNAGDSEIDKEAAEKAAVEDQAKEEAEEKYEKALNSWKDACLPLKLSIEIITNAFAFTGGDDGGDSQNDDYDDDMAWDSDQEEALLAEAQAQKQGSNLSKDDELFLNHVVSSGLPDRVLTVFGSVFMALVNSGKAGESIHSEVLEDLTEVLGKCSLCLGNIACNSQNNWKCKEIDLATMWNDFRQCLQAAQDTAVNQNIHVSAIAAALNIMGAFLRFRPVLVKCVNENDLEMILSFVLMEVPANSKSEDEAAVVVSDIQKDAIGIIGMLSSEPHPSTVNEHICEALLTLLQRAETTATAVIGEVLNALMDIYSADEGDANNHEGVFRSKGVLGAFQKSVPIFKKKIRGHETKGNVDYEEVEFLKEVGLNATRFIRYKKEH